MNLNKLFDQYRKPITAKKVRERAEALLYLAIILLVFFLFVCVRNYFWKDRVILLPVTTFGQRKELNKVVEFGFGNYFSGTEGTLYYKATSLLDFLVLQKISEFNIVDYIFVFVVAIFLYNSISKVQEGKAFFKRTVKAFQYIGYLTICMCWIKSLFNTFVAAPFFFKKTNHAFSLKEGHLNLYYMIIGALLLIFVNFLEQGNQLQEEQELTI